MARNVSDEELQLKKRARRRLVGAIVLVTVVAVVLPMILDSEPKPVSQNINIQIPSPNAGLLSKPPLPLKPAGQPAQAEAPPQPDTKAEAAPPAKAEPKPRPAAKPAPKPESAAKPKAAAKTTDAGGFVIQVVALADAARAKQLQEKIAAGGLKAYTEVVQTEKGPVTRVRVGPYASREAAENGHKQLQRLGLDGKVVSR